MKKSFSKIRFKALEPIFLSRSEFHVFKQRVNSERDELIELYQLLSSSNNKKFDTLFDISRQVQDRLDFQFHLIEHFRTVFIIVSVLFGVSLIFIYLFLFFV